MKNMKTLLAVIVALCLVMSLSIPVLATEVTDNTASTPTTAATEGATTAASEPAAAATEEDVATDEEAAEPTHVHEDGSVHTDADHAETETTGTETVEEEAGWKKPVRVVLIVLEVIFSVALAVIVLLQSGKESGLSGAISGNNDSYMSKSGKGGLDKMLAKSTKWVALLWLVVTLSLSLI